MILAVSIDKSVPSNILIFILIILNMIIIIKKK